jgi:hypothetical protein
VACGPDPKPDVPCDGPTFDLSVRAASGPLPSDTRLNVRYGGNHDGESYALGEARTAQAVFCTDTSADGGAAGVTSIDCRLYTQGPARLDVTATGYEPIVERDLTLTDEKSRCVPIEVVLEPLLDGGP